MEGTFRSERYRKHGAAAGLRMGWDVFLREKAVGWVGKRPEFSSEGRCLGTGIK